MSSLCFLLIAPATGWTQPAGLSLRHWTTADGLPSHSINSIAEGPDGYLWLTSQGGLIRFDGHRFEVFGNTAGLQGNRFHSLLVDHEGRLLVGGGDGRLYRRQGGQFVQIAAGFVVRSMGETAGGTLWAANSEARARLTGEGQWVDRAPAGNLNDVPGLVRFVHSGNIVDLASVNRVMQREAGAIFTSRRDGAHLIVGGAAGSRSWTLPAEPRPELRLVDRDGVLWITTAGSVAAYAAGRRAPLISFRLPGVTRINAVYQSADGQLWIGTDTAGLFRARKSPVRVVGRAQGATRDQIRYLGERPDGRVTLSDESGAYFTIGPGETSLRRDTTPGYVLTDQDGVEWFINHAAEPDVFETRRGRRHRLPGPVPLRLRVSPDSGPIRGVWIGGLTWVAHFVPGAGPDPFLAVQTGLQDVVAVAARPSGEALVLSADGLLRVAASGVKVLVPRSALPPGELRALHESADGAIWIGAYGGGLARVVGADVHRITAADGLAEDIVATIVGDGRGGLWTAGNRGIQWIGLRDIEAFTRGEVPRLFPVTLTREDDLPNPETSGWPAHRAADGRLWFPTFGGAVVVDPAMAVDPDALPPRVIIEGLEAGGRRQAGPDFAVPAASRRLMFTYTGIALSATGQVRFQHLLDGVDRTWIDAGTIRSATYTDVPPGRRRFLVRATRGGGWSEPAVAVVTIEPFWWETYWATLGGVVAALAAMFMAGRLRAAQLRQRAARLQALVDERTSELRAEQQTVAAQADELRRLDRARSQFFANISHEFRTPLTLIQGPLTDMAEGVHGPISATARDLLGLATANARRLLRLVDQLLDLSKADSGRLTLQAREIDMCAFVRGLCEAFEASARGAGLRFRVTAPPGAVMAWFDPDHLEKVVVNLVGNAIKYSEPGGTVEVEVAVVTPPASAVRLRVSDTGVGISADDLPYVFERYFRGQSAAAASRKGTGIGLALTREIVHLHRGTIVARSEVGQGSTFEVTLPLGREHLRMDEVASTGETSATADPESLKTVLVADDSPDIRQYLRQSLAGRFRIAEAVDGVEALEMLPSLMPDLVVSDVMMPRLDGIALCRAIKANPETEFVPVILLTARASPESRVGGLEGGADDYLVKPFNLRELTARIDNLIDQRRRWLARQPAEVARPGAHEAPAPPAVAPDPFIAGLHAAIEARLGEEGVTADSLAADLKVSRATLYRRVEVATGQSPMDVVWEVRLDNAARLLSARSGTVAEIAYGLGFTSLSHFSRRFRDRYGMSPSAWRSGRQ